MIKSLNNKAQGMSTSTIILLILGLIILVILVLGFSMGWDRLAPWVKSNNLGTVKATCNIACSTNSEYDFCVKLQSVNDGQNAKFSDTCHNLATSPKYMDRYYGIPTCSNIECPVSNE